MIKGIFVLSLLVLSVVSATDKEIIQQTLNGLFEENKMKDPTTIVPCIDDDTAHKIVVFVGTVLEKAARGSATDLISLIQDIKNFGDQIPQSVKDCLDGNEEFKALGLKYGIDDTSDPSVIEKKVITYVTLHYLTVHKWLGDLNNDWKAGKPYQVGWAAGEHGHTILGTTSDEIAMSDHDILQQLLNGIFEQNKLKDPTTIMPCIDDTTAHKLVVFIGDILDKLAKGSPSDINKVVQEIKDFGDQIPQSVKDCLNGNEEFKALGLKYGIDDSTDPSVIEKKVIAYIGLHYLTVHKWLGDLNSEWKAGKPYQVGFDAAAHGHTILGLTEEEVSKMLRFE